MRHPNSVDAITNTGVLCVSCKREREIIMGIKTLQQKRKKYLNIHIQKKVLFVKAQSFSHSRFCN